MSQSHGQSGAVGCFILPFCLFVSMLFCLFHRYKAAAVLFYCLFIFPFCYSEPFCPFLSREMAAVEPLLSPHTMGTDWSADQMRAKKIYNFHEIFSLKIFQLQLDSVIDV